MFKLIYLISFLNRLIKVVNSRRNILFILHLIDIFNSYFFFLVYRYFCYSTTDKDSMQHTFIQASIVYCIFTESYHIWFFVFIRAIKVNQVLDLLNLTYYTLFQASASNIFLLNISKIINIVKPKLHSST